MDQGRIDPRRTATVLLGLAQGRDPIERERLLIDLLAVLLQEVEALRTLAVAQEPAGYARAYESAAGVARSSAGPTTGLEKLLGLFLSESASAPRELLLLRRLGYSPAELRRVADELEHASSLS